MQHGRMSDDGRQRGNDWSVRIRVKMLGVKEKARLKKCKARFSPVKKNKAFQKSYVKVGGQKSCYERVWCQHGRGERGFMQWR